MEVNIIKNVYEVEAFVESETTEGTYYKVTYDDSIDWLCTCMAGKFGNPCKHIKLVKRKEDLK